MADQSDKGCPHCSREKNARFDVEKAIRALSRKCVALADDVGQYIAEADLDRPTRNARAKVTARKIQRIVGGTPSGTGEFPECCLIGSSFSNGAQSWFCTGVLVHPKIVLTAAHCQDPQSKINVVALSATRQTDLREAEIVRVKRVAVHHEYSPRGRGNDLAVLILKEPAKTAPTPIAPPAELAAAAQILLVGFGNNDIASAGGFGTQRHVDVAITSVRRQPNDDLNDDESRYGYESDLEFVAGDPGEDTCNGDSGGPAYIVVGGVRKVVGLTSRATDEALNPCGDGGIYTRVDQYLDFVRRVAERNGVAGL